jgi:poly-gamma-glutamate synthesis protein (capsule biosynthesis protein)
LTSRPLTAIKNVRLKAPPERAVWIREAGIDCLSIANNHTSDCGSVGLEDTISALGKPTIAGLRSKAALFRVKGVRIGVLAYTDFPRDAVGDVAIADPKEVQTSVDKLSKEVDLVVVSFHWGVENTSIVTPRQKMLAKAASNADIIVGHGPHVVQPVAKVGHAVVAFSLGDYVFDRAGKRVRWEVDFTAGQVTRTKLVSESQQP